MEIINLTEANFDTVLTTNNLMLVDFWADWCAPCRLMSLVLDRLAEQYGDQVTMAKVNVDQALELAVRFHVLAIPTVLTFKKGKLIDRQTGFMPGNFYMDLLNANLT